MAICPVCKAEVEEKKARGTSTVKERTYFFDTKGCKKQFDENPEGYIEK
jgi:YHS domain-containing protein